MGELRNNDAIQLFPRATSQADMLACPFGDCREGQIPRCLHRGIWLEDKKNRTAWDEEQEEWYFSIVDVISVLTSTENPRRYWSDLKRKLKKEGAVELYEKIVQLKMLSSDGKRYKTDVANTEQLLRIIQSVPSPKAEPFKAWLRGWQGWGGNGLKKPLTRNRPDLLHLWEIHGLQPIL